MDNAIIICVKLVYNYILLSEFFIFLLSKKSDVLYYIHVVQYVYKTRWLYFLCIYKWNNFVQYW